MYTAPYKVFLTVASSHSSLLINTICSSLTEIQNARGIMDVLADMLSAISPGNKEVRLKSDVTFIFGIMRRH